MDQEAIVPGGLGPGRIIAHRYRLLRMIGQGGMAVVYEAQDMNLSRRVAIKLLRPDYSHDGAFVKRFQQEAMTVARLNNPNIVRVYDYGEYNGSSYIVMELVEGLSLEQILEERGPLPINDAIRYMIEVCNAVEAAHHAGLVHRDLKPGNILLDADGHVKVVDFGIARAAGGSQMTTTGTTIGTAAYFSPEQAQGLEIGPASDIYALGVVLYELLTGRLPFEHENPITLALMHVRDQPPSPRLYNPRIPRSLESIILRCLSKDPAKRFPSVAALRDALLAYSSAPASAQQTVATVAPSLAQAPTMVVPSRPQPTRVVSQRVAAAPAPLPIYEEEEFAEDPFVEERGSGFGWPMWLAIGALLLLLCTGISYMLIRQYTLTQAFQVTPTQQIVATTVPNLIGKPKSEAEKLAGTNGWVLEVQRQNDPHPPDTIIDQSPKEGQSLPRGGRLFIIVSQPGPTAVNPITVPNVIGKQVDQAIIALNKAGITQIKQKGQPSTQQAGTVIDQLPAANALVMPGSEVTLVVAAPMPTATPTVPPTATPTITPTATITPTLPPTKTPVPATNTPVIVEPTQTPAPAPTNTPVPPPPATNTPVPPPPPTNTPVPPPPPTHTPVPPPPPTHTPVPQPTNTKPPPPAPTPTKAAAIVSPTTVVQNPTQTPVVQIVTPVVQPTQPSPGTPATVQHLTARE